MKIQLVTPIMFGWLLNGDTFNWLGLMSGDYCLQECAGKSFTGRLLWATVTDSRITVTGAL